MDAPLKTLDCNGDATGAFHAAHCSVSGRTHLDLFSGIGGFALAAQMTGWKTIGFSEIEPYACKILKRHWPEVPNHGDIRNIRGVRADLITGGFPCQPFSVAGQRRGAEDDRHLWPEMCRVIDEARPAWVLGENVPGIIGMELDRVLSDLEHLGYACWPVVVPACAVDARHRRDRLWVVAYAERLRRRESAAYPEASQKPLDTTERKEGASRAGSSGETISDAERSGRNGARIPKVRRQGIPEPARRGESFRGLGQADCFRWPTEPELGRVVNGIPNRPHRLRGLGNAIVPQVAALLMDAMARTLNSDYQTPVA